MHASSAVTRGLWPLLVSAMVVLAPASARAQARTATVSDLIGSIKQQKELALQPRPGPASPVQRPAPEAGPAHKPVSAAPPMVWSVTGLNQQFTAVLVHDRKVYTVVSDGLPRTLGGWRVHQINEQAVLVSRESRSLRLPVPDVASSPFPFVQALTPPVGEFSPLAGPGAGTMASEGLTAAQALATRLPVLPARGEAR